MGLVSLSLTVKDPRAKVLQIGNGARFVSLILEDDIIVSLGGMDLDNVVRVRKLAAVLIDAADAIEDALIEERKQVEHPATLAEQQRQAYLCSTRRQP